VWGGQRVVALLIEVSCYEPEGSRFDSPWGHRFFVFVFNLPNTSSSTITLGLTQPLTKMSTRNLPCVGTKLKNDTPWSESASELHRPSDRRLSAVSANFLRIESATWSAWRIPMAVFSVFWQEPLLFYQIAPQLYSRGWVDPVPDPLLFFFR
jgi:hypothetical protein